MAKLATLNKHMNNNAVSAGVLANRKANKDDNPIAMMPERPLNGSKCVATPNP